MLDDIISYDFTINVLKLKYKFIKYRYVFAYLFNDYQQYHNINNIFKYVYMHYA